jgi:uncharacterized lipoprotein YddW (UPF0748 family)
MSQRGRVSRGSLFSSFQRREARFALLAAVALIAWIGWGANSPAQGGENRAPGIPPGARLIGYSSPGHPPKGSASATRGEHRPAAWTPAPAQTPGLSRAIWVTRWNYQTAEDVERIVANCAALGANAIFFQARGAGTAFYRSDIEPWAYELTSKSPASTGRDPGWDPLGTALAAARRHGVQLHAYINVMPGWRAAGAPPAAAKQLWTAHPDWFAVDARGQRMDPAAWYAFLDPALPEVRGYLARLAAELVQRYPVDGVHLDYIRYPGEMGEYGYAARSVALFRSETGLASPSANPEAWRSWRSARVEATAAGIKRAVQAVRPNCLVSAAVFADPDTARLKNCQLSWEWVGRRSVDLVIPMNYVADEKEFHKRASFFAERVPKGRLAMGLLAEHGSTKMSQQISVSRSLGVDRIACFAYGDFFPNHQPSYKAKVLSGLWGGRVK